MVEWQFFDTAFEFIFLGQKFAMLEIKISLANISQQHIAAAAVFLFWYVGSTCLLSPSNYFFKTERQSMQINRL
jgi:hypothetical protein